MNQSESREADISAILKLFTQVHESGAQERLLGTLAKVSPELFNASQVSEALWAYFYVLSRDEQIKAGFVALAEYHKKAAAPTVFNYFFSAGTPFQCEQALPFALAVKEELLEVVLSREISGDLHVVAQKFTLDHLLEEVVRRKRIDILVVFLDKTMDTIERGFINADVNYALTFQNALLRCGTEGIDHVLRFHVKNSYSSPLGFPRSLIRRFSEEDRLALLVNNALIQGDFQFLSNLGLPKLRKAMDRMVEIAVKAGADRVTFHFRLLDRYAQVSSEFGKKELPMEEHPEALGKFRKPEKDRGLFQTTQPRRRALL